nr:hypothetical protein L204_06376 [Cryptococcus depauperatus CBS 7855]
MSDQTQRIFQDGNATPEFQNFLQDMVDRMTCMEELKTARAQLAAHTTPIVSTETPAPPIKEPKIALPAPFSGRRDDPKTYASDEMNTVRKGYDGTSQEIE